MRCYIFRRCLCPQWFLPLACTANLVKNLAAVAASATRAPIYRTFALQVGCCVRCAAWRPRAGLWQLGALRVRLVC